MSIISSFDSPITCDTFKHASQAQFEKAQFVIIDAEYVNQRLDNFLLAKIKGVPKSYIYRIIRKNDVRVNKKRASNTYRLQKNDIVRIPPIRVAENNDTSQAPEYLTDKIAQSVLHEDSDLIVLNKPHGIAVHGGSGIRWGVIEAINTIKPEWKNAELIHRIDKETSGLLLIAKRRAALRYYQQLLREKHKSLVKCYHFVCHGRWKGTDTATITAPLLRTSTASGERIVRVDGAGKYAETDFTLQQHLNNASIVQAVIKTGRTHQIRVHSQYARRPVIGDSKYAYQANDKLLQQLSIEKLPRMMLHASSITLPLRPKADDRSQKSAKHKLVMQTFTAPFDSDWDKMIKILKK